MENNTYLAHHGILGQKWGVRRYQNYDGSLTELGRKRRGIGGKKQAQKKKKAAELQAKVERKKAENAARQHENLKKHVREHPKELYKYRMEFTQEEVNKLIEEIQFDRKIKDIRQEEIDRGWATVKKITDNIGTVKRLLDNTKGIYNLAADVNNMLIDSGTYKNKKKAVKIGENPNEKNSDSK